jgi:hypothetical protein
MASKLATWYERKRYPESHISLDLERKKETGEEERKEKSELSSRSSGNLLL